MTGNPINPTNNRTGTDDRCESCRHRRAQWRVIAGDMRFVVCTDCAGALLANPTTTPIPASPRSER